MIRGQVLVETFLQDFECVTEWEGYEKPKFHPLSHLKQSLLEFGPFRAYWCMPWEAFIQVLKKMFRMCNWKSAPFTVGKHWACKSVMHYRDPARASWHENVVHPCSEFRSDLTSMKADSPLVSALLRVSSSLRSLRFLQSVSRAGKPVERGDWVLLERPETPSWVGQVQQLVEVICCGESSGSFIRLWCLSKLLQRDPDGTMWSIKGSSQPLLILFEETHVTKVSQFIKAEHEEYI